MKKLKITLPQLLKVLETQKPKYPITIVMNGIDKAEVEKLVDILKKEKKD